MPDKYHHPGSDFANNYWRIVDFVYWPRLNTGVHLVSSEFQPRSSRQLVEFLQLGVKQHIPKHIGPSRRVIGYFSFLK
jgi:hypothetical protein